MKFHVWIQHWNVVFMFIAPLYSNIDFWIQQEFHICKCQTVDLHHVFLLSHKLEKTEIWGWSLNPRRLKSLNHKLIVCNCFQHQHFKKKKNSLGVVDLKKNSVFFLSMCSGSVELRDVIKQHQQLIISSNKNWWFNVAMLWGYSSLQIFSIGSSNFVFSFLRTPNCLQLWRSQEDNCIT